MNRDRIKHWLYHGSVVVFVILIGAFLVVSSGIVPVKASARHWPITEWLLRYAMKRSITTHSFGTQVPDLSDRAMIIRGAGHYETGCRACHGSPGTPVPLIAANMTPPAPSLPDRVNDLTPEKLFYVVKHGLKFTGMPAWPAQDRDDEVWAVVAFLQTLPSLDESAYRTLVFGEATSALPTETLTPPTEQVSSTVFQSCLRCHGQDGLGRSGAFPVLAGQNRDYLRNAMHAYAQGLRPSGMMQPVVTGLNAETIDHLVTYFSQLPLPPGSSRDSAAVIRGQQIATQGIPSERVPACMECHALDGKQRKPAYPLLSGQSSGYLETQLSLFHANVRGGSHYAHLMQPIAARLTPEQMRDLAKYFEAQR